jgi:hypothetical protein
MKVIINKLYINTTKQDGTQLINKKGEPYTMVNIEYTSGTINGKASMYCGGKFGAKDLEVVNNWTEGQEVELVFTQNGEYTNFSIPSRADKLEEMVIDMHNRLKAVEELLRSKGAKI